MTFSQCEIFRLHEKLNEINPLTRLCAFHIAKQYFTLGEHFTNPIGIYLVEGAVANAS